MNRFRGSLFAISFTVLSFLLNLISTNTTFAAGGNCEAKIQTAFNAFCANTKQSDFDLLDKLNSLLNMLQDTLNDLNQFGTGFDPMSCIGVPNFGNINPPDFGSLLGCLSNLNLNFIPTPPDTNALNGLQSCLSNVASSLTSLPNFSPPNLSDLQQCLSQGNQGLPDFDTAIGMLNDIKNSISGLLGGGSGTPGIGDGFSTNFLSALKNLKNLCKTSCNTGSSSTSGGKKKKNKKKKGKK